MGLTASQRKDREQMEQMITDAETQVESCRQAFEDPAVAGDPEESQKRWDAIQAARGRVDALYARWQDLESRAPRR